MVIRRNGTVASPKFAHKTRKLRDEETSEMERRGRREETAKQSTRTHGDLSQLVQQGVEEELKKTLGDSHTLRRGP